ncbi:methyltransferase [Flavihumibacter petaseus]|uniref:Putative methyltransferase n=1 Tax=Flavihumibacter petaseus NBRC 106054 TaxID=1220578 RepID=A0A0E9MX59_9BACT|nr:methyltransferase [Flavihumibacter petaseus]GAO42088.1 putative methyltransferase [Flavihumibacter petaseus NBRC 106054]
MNHFSKFNLSAIQAKEAAQRIAFGPVMFQAAQAMRRTGLLMTVRNARNAGITLEDAAEQTGIPVYGARVLMEAGLGMEVFTVDDNGLYRITTTGYFLLFDDLTIANLNFVDDVCYDGLAFLEESIRNGKPEGLRVFGKWDTIYEGLSRLPEDVQKSWFAFDHHYSDGSFPLVIKIVFELGVQKMIDIGTNTGKWALACLAYHPDVHITMMDLPGQLQIAERRVREKGFADRTTAIPVNILDENAVIPKGHDTIWMSQFLDCFSEQEITSIVRRCYDALDENGKLLILENFWDVQEHYVAALTIQMTSLYFTALANGNSQMYDSRVFIKAVEAGGFYVEKQINHIGEAGHTLLVCRKKPIPPTH